jgi:hypothetical protein
MKMLMKTLIITFSITFSFTLIGQGKYESLSFNKLIEVQGTDFVIARVDSWVKKEDVKQNFLLFIDTKNGQTHQVDFPKEGTFSAVEQIKVDNLGINSLLVPAKTIDANNKNGIDWQDPTQIFILSPDGKQKTLLTDSRFFANTWIVNKQTGTIIISGHYDTNNNGKHDKADKNEIEIYDLKSLKLISKVQ